MASTNYFYTREIIDGRYNINNINHTNSGEVPVPLYKEIKAEPTLPDDFKIVCSEAVCTITFDPALSSAQETTLDGIVANQKINN